MERADRNDSSKHPRVHFEADTVHYRRNSSFPSSSCSSSSGSSLESYVIDKEDANNSSPESKQAGPESQGPLSSQEFNSQTLPWSMQSSSSAHSSQFQMLGGRPAGYDPSRIPTTIFASKPSAGMDWSVASNESLFSLHVGNNSFSRDQFAIMNLNKSGELYKSGELFKSGELTRADEFFYIPTPLPTVTEESKNHNVEKETVEIQVPKVEKESDENISANVVKEKVGSMSENVETDSIEIEEVYETEKTDLTDTPPRDNSKDKLPLIEIRQSGLSNRSDDSNNSTKSFQFPLLVGHDAERNSPAKMVSLKQQSQVHIQQEMHKEEEPRTPETPVKTTTQTTSWFSCFYCFAVCR